MIARLYESLELLDACSGALQWVEQQSGSRREMWDACPNGEWLMWLGDMVGVDYGLMRAAADRCTAACEARGLVPACKPFPWHSVYRTLTRVPDDVAEDMAREFAVLVRMVIPFETIDAAFETTAELL